MLSVTHSPKVLTIQLKRAFRTGDKLRRKVTFPMHLTETHWSRYFTDGKQLPFKLIGAIEHTGSYTYGHYISFAQRNNAWYRFDDDRVSISSVEQVSQCEVYCLFYAAAELEFEH
eukprot:Selendium_serpulae@DN3093_c0_g1_i1.p2